MNDPFFIDPSEPDTTAPTATIETPGDGTPVTGTSTVSGAATDNVAVTTCALRVDGATVETGTPANGRCSFAWDSRTVADGTHTLALRATDAAGNFSGSGTISVTVSNPPDVTPPPVPTDLTATTGTSGGTKRITVSWSAATDNVGVDTYWLFRGNSKYLWLPGDTTSYVDTGLNAGERYVYKTYAIDAANNWSASSGNTNATAR